MRQQLHIRVDGNATIGHGHYIRCLALAQMVAADFECHFYSITIPENARATIINEQFVLHELAHEADFLQAIQPNDLVLIDGYSFDLAYQTTLKEKNAILCMIDDAPTGTYTVDCLINHAPGGLPENYQLPQNGQFALGTDYALVRKGYQQKAKEELPLGDNDAVFVCFGGADPKLLTIETVKLLIELACFKRVIVVIGTSFQAKNELLNLVEKQPEISVHSGVSEIEMIDLMLTCQFAIVPTSSLLFEALALHRTIISGCYIENQQQLYTEFKQLNAFVDAGNFKKEELKKALLTVKESAVSERVLIDGWAPIRFQNLFARLTHHGKPHLIKALPSHVELTYKWATDPVIRAFSFSEKTIEWDEHQAWYSRKMNDNACFYYLAVLNDEFIGTIRFDCFESQAVISYLIDSAFHGKGYGSWILKEGIDQLERDLTISSIQVHEIIGNVIPSNTPSVKSFEKLNFGKTESAGVITYRMKR